VLRKSLLLEQFKNVLLWYYSIASEPEELKLDALEKVYFISGLTGDTIVPQIDIFNVLIINLFLCTFWENPTDANIFKKILFL